MRSDRARHQLDKHDNYLLAARMARLAEQVLR
jgi:hypothetical protein